jgi:hypothetical protein
MPDTKEEDLKREDTEEINVSIKIKILNMQIKAI